MFGALFQRHGRYQSIPTGDKKCNPEKNASFWSKVTYSWYSSVITLGYKKPLEREDLFELNEDDSTYSVCPSFEKHWQKEVSKYKKESQVPCDKPGIQKPSLLFPLWHMFKVLVIQIALLKVAADVLAFISPQILKWMITFCENSSALSWYGYIYSLTLLFVAVLQTLVLQLYQRLNMVMAAKIKMAVTGLIYKKVWLHPCSISTARTTSKGYLFTRSPQIWFLYTVEPRYIELRGTGTISSI